MVAHDGQQGSFLAGVARDLGIDTVAVVTDEKPVSQGLANDFRNAFVAGGGTVLSFEVVPEGETDYGPYAERAADVEPELLFFGGEYDHAAVLKEDAVDAGLTVPLMGGDGIQADQYIELTGDISEGDLASSVGRPVELEPEGTQFLEAYDAIGFEEPPSTFGPYAYDAANILISAAAEVIAGREHLDPDIRAQIAVAVQDVTNADLVNASGAVTGEIGFDEFGDTVNPVLTSYRVEDAEWVPFEP
jgi:branched-chain amino acid transport system substrate-binding protein